MAFEAIIPSSQSEELKEESSAGRWEKQKSGMEGRERGTTDHSRGGLKVRADLFATKQAFHSLHSCWD
ncbi:hypothetical protein TNCV_960711 [Trichonephila clavipes]|nr:hypothetical protein TNCV_960711 [Trichonephila clavipes]